MNNFMSPCVHVYHYAAAHATVEDFLLYNFEFRVIFFTRIGQKFVDSPFPILLGIEVWLILVFS